MRIAYASSIGDVSGYSNAARNYIMAIRQAGIDVDVLPLSFEDFESKHEQFDDILSSMVVEQSKAKIRIVHTVPLSYPVMMNKDKGAYNIGYTTWEADRIPPDWVPYINLMDEVWVPCEQNVGAFKFSGVSKPIKVVPHTFDVDFGTNRYSDHILPSIKGLEGRFVFYSILQWTNRKRPDALLKSYMTEFSKTDPVALVLKTYIVNPNNPMEAEQIKIWINDIKKGLKLDNYPSIYLLTSLLTDAQMEALHQKSDCFVLLHAAEGFGIPICDSMLAGNPVITTGYGGPSDFIEHKKNGLLVDYQMTPVYGMPWKTYTGDMNWANPNICTAKKYMRWVYENKEESSKMGRQAQTSIRDNYSWEAIGNKITNRLREIQEQLDG